MENTDNKYLQWLLEFKQDNLIQKVVQNLNTFENPDAIKLMSLQQLKVLLDRIKDKLTFPQFSLIYNSLVKQLLIFFDQKEFKNEIFYVAYLLGQCISLDVSFELISQSIRNDIEKNSQKNLIYNLAIIEHITTATFKVQNYDNLVTPLITLLHTMQSLIRDNDVIAYKSLVILQNILKNNDQKLNMDLNTKEKLFQIIFLLKSNEKLKEFNPNELIKIIAQKQDQQVDDLIHESCKQILNQFYQSKNYFDWDQNSLERIEFNELVKNVTDVVRQFLDIILDIISYQIINEKDFITQFDSLESLNKIILNDKSYTLQPYTQQILENIIEKSLVWKVGAPNSKIRKASLLCFKNYILMQSYNKEIILQRFQQYLPLLETNAGDDRAPDVRYITMEFCIQFLDQFKDELQRDDIGKFYELIIFRLDDAQDEIRIKSAIAMQKIFQSKNINFSHGIKEYILKTLFIHFDDSNESLRIEIQKALEYFTQYIDKDMTKEMAEKSIQKYRFPKQCKILLEYINSI